MHLRSPFVVSDIRYEKQEPTLYQARKQNTTAFPSFTFATDIIEINRFFFSRKDDDCSCSELVDMAKFNWSNFQKGHTELPLGVCFVLFCFFCRCVTFSEKQEIDDAIQQGLSRGNES